MSALTDAIYQNTPGNSVGRPLGLPTSYSWYNGDTGLVGSVPPSNFTSSTAWGQIYPEKGFPVVSGNIQMQGFQEWLHLKKGGWVEAQFPSQGIQGSHYPANFHGSTIRWNETRSGDVTTVDAPVAGRNDHFWPDARGDYAPGTVDGVFVELQARTTNPNMHYVANLGADWWRNHSAPFLSDFSNSPGAGMSDWVELSTSWKTLYFFSWDNQRIAADPPPPLRGSSTTSTAPTSPTSLSSPSLTTPVLTIADSTLWVAGGGGTVDLGVNVTTSDLNDLVTVNITGLPTYETITDKLDGQTFSGNNITLTAAQVDSGLVLQSNYRGGGHPVATLTLTAHAKDPVTGAVTSAAPKTITVTDPRPAATTSPQTNHHHTNHHHTSASTVAATAPQPITAMDHLPAVAAGAGVLANRGFAQLQQHMGLGTSTLAATAPQAITLADHLPAAGTATASLASQSFALLNQYLAGNSGRVDPGQIVAAVSQAAGRGQETFLTRPQH
jgi:hypothetical protein